MFAWLHVWLLPKAANDVFENKNRNEKALGQLGFPILPETLLLFAWIKLIKAPFIPMSLITWSCYVQNLSRQADETNNWGHLENSRELCLTHASLERFMTRVTIFQKGSLCYAGPFIQIKWLWALKFSCQDLSSWSFSLSRVVNVENITQDELFPRPDHLTVKFRFRAFAFRERKVLHVLTKTTRRRVTVYLTVSKRN